MKLSEAIILITGGGKGIGNFIALGLLEKVSGVIILDNDEELIDKLPKKSSLVGIKCDVTNPIEVESVINKIFDELGGVNVCINNAGIIHSEPLINILTKGDKKHSLSNWQKVIEVNLNSVFYVTANVVEKMVAKRQPGVIINISSISAKGNVGQSVYSATKAGVEALAKTWSKELGMFKIRAVAIAPGFFNTQSTKDSLSENVLQKWQKAVPLGKLGELDQMLSAVEFVIQNDYFNGKTLAIDGGLTI